MENLPYIAHESDMARMERINKRLVIVITILIISLVGSNAAWIAYESQFQTVDTTQTVTQEADGENISLVGISE